MKEICITAQEAGKRLDRYLSGILKEAPMSFIYKMLRKKNITLNGSKADGKEILATGNVIKIFLADDTYAKFAGNPTATGSGSGNGNGQPSRALSPDPSYQKAFESLKKTGVRVVYEDEHILAVNKPAGVLTQKAKPADLSLNEWLIGYLLDQGQTSAELLQRFRPSVCNRLDRNTSGLVLCSKTTLGAQNLSAFLRDRTIHKYYLTLVSGVITGAGEQKAFLYKDKARNESRILSEQEAEGFRNRDALEAIDTAWTPMQVSTFRNVTLLKVDLRTGKSHQIRAQLAHLGHPLIGDPKYGSAKVNAWYRDHYGIRSQLLHSALVVFPQDLPDCRLLQLPGLTLEAPLPKAFERITTDGNMEFERP